MMRWNWCRKWAPNLSSVKTNKFKLTLSDRSISGQIAQLLNENNQLINFHNADTIYNDRCEYFIELCGNKVIGCVGLLRDRAMDKIMHLSVHQNYRRIGIAKRLLHTALTNSNNTLIYASVREENKASLNLFHNHGFEVIAYLPNEGYNVFSLCLERGMKNNVVQ